MRCATCGDPVFASADGSGLIAHTYAGRFNLPELPYDHLATLLPAAPDPAIVREFRLIARQQLVSRERVDDVRLPELVEQFADMMRRVAAIEYADSRIVTQWIDYGCARVGLDANFRFVRIEFDDLPTLVELHKRVEQ